jgi:hypothetical protein
MGEAAKTEVPVHWEKRVLAVYLLMMGETWASTATKVGRTHVTIANWKNHLSWELARAEVERRWLYDVKDVAGNRASVSNRTTRTPQKDRKFLAELRRTGNVTAALAHSGGQATAPRQRRCNPHGCYQMLWCGRRLLRHKPHGASARTAPKQHGVSGRRAPKIGCYRPCFARPMRGKEPDTL